MDITDLTPLERRIWQAFPRGVAIDVRRERSARHYLASLFQLGLLGGWAGLVEAVSAGGHGEGPTRG
ncbi:hypothetical protein, partial [Streptomyces sp. NPDC091215]|uniref:hypothetical protein n=1 Tax=Streptomyces sp. NPDC091215 TaxID=3155192 RepID=UPI00343076FC